MRSSFSVHQPGPQTHTPHPSGPAAFGNTPNTPPNRLGSAPEAPATPSTDGPKLGSSVGDKGASKRVRKKPVLYTRGRIELWRLFLCSAMVPRTVADPTTSMGATNSAKHMRTRGCTVQTPSSAYTAATVPLSRGSMRVHVPRAQEGSGSSEAIQLPPSGAPRSQLEVRRASRRATGAHSTLAARRGSACRGSSRAHRSRSPTSGGRSCGRC